MDNSINVNEYVSRFPWISWLVSNKVMGTVITANCVVVFLMLFPELPVETMDYLRSLDTLFNIYFILEAAIKISIDGRRYFHNPADIFDFTLVVLVILAYIFGDYQSAMGLYILRIIRVMKFTMVFKKIKGSKTLFDNIRSAFRASLGVLLVMGTLIIIIAMMMTIFFDSKDPQYFGNPLKSTYTVLRLFTLEGWYEIPDNLAANLPYFQAFLVKGIMCSIVILGGIFGISFITSNVTDNLAQDDTERILKKIEELEKKIDSLQRNDKGSYIE